MNEIYEDRPLYCDKCGNTYVFGAEFDDCRICKNKLKIVPNKYLLFEDAEDEGFLSEAMEQKLRKELVLTSPNFDKYYFDHRDEIQKELDKKSDEHYAEWEQMLAKNQGRDKGNSYGVTCPYCKATNVRKIGIVSRSISASIFGLGSKKIGKQWHCDHCGSDF